MHIKQMHKVIELQQRFMWMFFTEINYIFIYILIHIICIFHGNISEFLYTYQSGWFFAIFNDFSSSSFNVFICEKVGFTLSCAVASVPFDIPFSIRCKVFLWRITSCPHFVIFTSSKILLHECKTHCWREKKTKENVKHQLYINMSFRFII